MERFRLSLDGTWQLWPDPAAQLSPETLSDADALSVHVPAPLQAQAESLSDYTGPAWYRRGFEVPAKWLAGRRLSLGFGAAEHLAEVWVNGQPVGCHAGGYLPFEFDVTEFVRPGANTVTVHITDPSEQFLALPHGKQSWYGPLSGLWQPTWLEARAPKHVVSLRVTPQGERIQIRVELNAALTANERLSYVVSDPAGAVCAASDSDSTDFAISVPKPHLWELDEPNLYRLQITVQGAAGTDVFADTFGFRTIETRDGRLYLNGRPLYLRSALDQDYYPDLICTPPSLDYLISEFRKAKAMGLNCLRVHIKVADPRYYQAADQVGLLVWTEVPNWSHLDEAAERHGRELIEGMIARDWNRPSIVIRSIINEAWGTELASNPDHWAWLAEMYARVKALDPTRLVVDNSPCAPSFHIRTDIEDFHFYAAMPDGMAAWDSWLAELAQRPAWLYAPGYQPPASEAGRAPLIVSEFGNWGLPDVAPLLDYYQGEPWWFETGWEWGPGEMYPHGVTRRYRALHLDKVFGSYGGFAHAAQWSEYEALKYQIESMRLHPEITGYVITELTDVHWECNGLLDMLRNPKVFAGEMANLNADSLVIARPTSYSGWAGETIDVDLSLSHVGPEPLRGARLEWSLSGASAGTYEELAAEPFSSVPIGRARLVLPAMDQPGHVRLELALYGAAGQLLSRNQLDLSGLPRLTAWPGPVACPDPALARTLRALGCDVTSDAEAPTVVTRMDRETLRLLQRGNRVFFIAEQPEDLQAPVHRLELMRRQGVHSPGNAALFAWFRRDKLGHFWPGDGRFDFACSRIVPQTIIRQFNNLNYEHEVLAGVAAGWLHHPAAYIQLYPVGRGRLLVSTLRLRDELGRDPLATAVFHGLLDLLYRSR